MITKPQKYSVYDLLAVKNELEDELQNKVDLVEFDSIRPPLKEAILSSQVSILKIERIFNTIQNDIPIPQQRHRARQTSLTKLLLLLNTLAILPNNP